MNPKIVTLILLITCVELMNGQELPNLSHNDVSCQSESINITIGSSYLSQPGIDIGNIGSVYMINDSNSFTPLPGCAAVESSGTYIFNLASDFLKCASQHIQVNTTHALVAFYIRFQPAFTSIVTRDATDYLNVQCVFDTTPDTAVIGPLTPLTKVQMVSGNSSVSPLNVIAGVYTDVGFTQKLVLGRQIPVDDTLYFQFSLESPAADIYILQASRCWATPEGASSPQYEIITNNCHVADILDSGASGVIENFQSSKVQFFFKSFVWTADEVANSNIQVTCSVKVCNPDLMTCTDSGCSSRRKRNADKNDGLPETLVDIGPITVTTEEIKDESYTTKDIPRIITDGKAERDIAEKCKRCSNGCRTTVTDVETYITSCVCPADQKLARDQRSCENDKYPVYMGKAKGMLDIRMPTGADLGVVLVAVGFFTFTLLHLCRNCQPRKNIEAYIATV